MTAVPNPGRMSTGTELVNGLFEQVWTQGHIDMVPAFIHPDYTLLDARGEVRVSGQKEYTEGVDAYRALFQDVQMCATHVMHSGDGVAYRSELTGWLTDIDHLGPGLRIVERDIPEVRLISFRGISIARLSDGLMVEEICEIDTCSLHEQLGWWK